MRLAAAVLSVILCSVAGHMRAHKSEMRQAAVDEFLNDIRQISMQIEFTSDPICIIIDKISKNSKLRPMWQSFINCLNSGMTCTLAWHDVSESHDLMSVLQDEEKDGLDNFFSTLGQTDKSTEKKNAEYVYKLLGNISERRKTAVQNEKKMYKSIGILAGIGVAIMII
ncbi:MAG: stage III sporulation protein AB [Clostridia bacterium]|nr:stage III sporulation protein AB [Clostridia bacterium]